MKEDRIFRRKTTKPINNQLDNLEIVNEKVNQIKNEADTIIREIRSGFVKCVVIFIDLVDSTKFKIENKGEPEKWILRVKQFSEIIREYIENSNGKVVKYIGDEVMGVFDQDTQIDDALGLILRINNIEGNLTEISGFQTNIKMALDYGDVFMLKYDGHNEPDPQGTPIDRCARIGKYCEPNTILSSYEFVSSCTFPKHWMKIGTVKMKGLGIQPVYQYGEQTIELMQKIEIEESKLNELNNRIEELTDENQNLSLDKTEMISTISELQNQLKEAGEKPIIETDFLEQDEKELQEQKKDEIFTNLKKIRKMISDSGAGLYDYARFLFLKEKGYGDKYNTFEGRTFDACIEKDLVVQDSDEMFELNMDNKRNRKVLELIHQTERMIREYISSYGVFDEDDLFEYSFSDADFWSEYVEINVV